jgi:hypothetical protein
MPEICEPLSQILVSSFDPGQAIDVICTSTQSFLVYYCSTNFGGDPGYMVGVNSAAPGGTTGSNSPVFIVGGVPDDVITFRLRPGATRFITLQTTCSATASIYVPSELHPSPLAQPGPPHPPHP